MEPMNEVDPIMFCLVSVAFYFNSQIIIFELDASLEASGWANLRDVVEMSSNSSRSITLSSGKVWTFSSPTQLRAT